MTKSDRNNINIDESNICEAFKLLDECDDWMVAMSTHEHGVKKYQVRVWKKRPGSKVSTGASGWGDSAYDAIMEALAVWETWPPAKANGR